MTDHDGMQESPAHPPNLGVVDLWLDQRVD
jgi:hypothetical protein